MAQESSTSLVIAMINKLILINYTILDHIYCTDAENQDITAQKNLVPF